MNSKAPDLVKERPILFKGDMVNAILEERKTQTRRVVKSPVEIRSRGDLRFSEIDNDWQVYGAGGVYLSMSCPYGKLGDRLWVRETFADIGPRLTYRADTDDGAHCKVGRWTPSIYMPRWASRITLEITDVRVERLNDISEEDAKAEGAPKAKEDHVPFHSRRMGFEILWESINGPGSWDENPWVWVVEFKKM
jgi:hypothetical protein